MQSEDYTSGGAFCSADDVIITNRIMAYLALVYRVRDSYEEESIREAVYNFQSVARKSLHTIDIFLFWLRAHVEAMSSRNE